MSIFSKTGSAIGGTISVLSGYRTLRGAVKTTREIVADRTAATGWGAIKEALGLLRRQTAARTETFAEACARQGVTAQDLETIAARLGLQATLYRRCGIAGILLAVASAVAADGFYWYVLHLAAGLAVAALVFALAIRAEFRLWQVQRRELASFAVFRDDGGIVRGIAG